MLIGKIISSKQLYKRGVLNILHNIWSIDVDLMIREAGVNTYSTSFVNKVLKRRAMEESLLLIMGHYVVLKECKKGAIVKVVQFLKIFLWLQIHNVSLSLLIKANAEDIGKKLGRVVVVEDPNGDLVLEDFF